MPANYVWAPPAGMLGMPPPPPPSFSTLTNWRVGVGPTDFATELPNSDDHLFFIGGISSANCTIPDQTPTAPTNAFAGIHLNFGLEAVPTEIGSPPPPPTNVPYSGTVTVADSLAVGELDVDCGAIAQADPNAPTGTAGTLTVNGHLDWIGGTLNSNSVAGTIALAPGATGIAEPSVTNPGINGTVQLGSEIRLLGDGTTSGTSTLTMNNGVYDLVGGFFHATAGSLLVMAPVPKAPSIPGNPSIFVDNKKVNKPTVWVGEGARGKVTSVGRSNSTEVVEVKLAGGFNQFTNRGDTTIESYTRVKIKKTGAASAKYYQDYDPAEAEPKPITKLQAGSEIVAESDGDQNTGFVHIKEGEFQVYGVPNLGDGNQPDAVISVPDKDKSPALYLAQGTKLTTHFFSDFVNLKVVGDVVCLGDIFFRADRGTELRNDSLVATGAIVFGPRPLSPSELKVVWRNPGANLAAVDSKWIFLFSDDPLRATAVVFPAIPGVTTLPPLRTWPNETDGTIADMIGAKEIGMKRTA